ncbi:MAG: histidine phosphotransferase family protein [Pseudomonadota bacterium]
MMTLASLVASRVCHDLISPVSALTTGLEVLQDDPDEDMRQHALELIDSSAAQASAKLQFVRLAFGAAGARGAELDLDEARVLAEKYFQFVKPELNWRAPGRVVNKDVCKIALNLCLLSIEAIPRGGVVDVETDADGGIVFTATGPKARFSEISREALAGGAESYDAKSVQPYYTGRLIADLRAEVVAEEGEEVVVFRFSFPH